MEEGDVRFKYIHRQVVQAFRNVPIERLNEYWGSEIVSRIVYDFLDNPETQAIFFKEGKGSIEISDVPSKTARNVLFYVVKLNKSAVSEDRIMHELIFGDVAADPLEHMASLSQRVFQPIVSSQDSPAVWTETIAKEVRDNFETFVANVQITQGHVRGVTCLPLPSAGGPKRDEEFGQSEKDSGSSSGGGGDMELHSQIHALEGAIITWTKQIKNVLKKDSENVFQTQTDPGPLVEVEFWLSKASNLNGIFDQLQSSRVRRVLKVLDKSKSTYNAPFAKLCKEVFHARAEANNIVKYLRPLVSWFHGLENETDFDKLVNHFPPIMHLILLVWKSSAYYNTTSRLVILMREICNTIIRQASTYLNGDAIFELIEAGETNTAIKMLQTSLRVFGKFKSIYFDYKTKAQAECPDNPWRVQNNAVFVRLDSFLERCHDILDLAQTILMFSKLQKIEIGGTKGKTLSASITQIYNDFTQAIDMIKSVGKGILDLENKDFDDAFYDFRNRIKELDRRLGSVLIQGFDDTNTVTGRFRLFDTFDTLVTRPIIADELEKKHAALIESMRTDVEDISRIFNERNSDPPLPINLPPISGALMWCRGLLDRAQLPLEKLKTLDKKILEREDTRDVLKIYTSLIGQLSDFDSEKIEGWAHSIEDSSQAKLKNSLLRREGAEAVLAVNFDSILVKLLREVKYFLLLGLEVSPGALEIYQRAEVFRRHMGNLDLIVNMYNDIQFSLLPVERPMVKSQLEKLDKTLAQGIGEGKNKAKALNWKSNGIDLFIGEAMTEAKEVSELLQMLKGNLKHIESTVGIWQTTPMFERGGKTAITEDFMALQKKTRQAKLAAIKESGQDVHRLLKDTNKKLKVSHGSPDWKAYVDFINDVVVYGLVEAMASSLRAMAAQFNPAFLRDQSLSPLIEIQMDLVDNKVVFVPEVGLVLGAHAKGAKTGLKNIVNGWINGMLGLSSAFKRLDTTEGTYLRELAESPEVLIQRARVSKFLDLTEANANKLRTIFRKFESLWLTDLNKLFAEFIEKAITIELVPFDSADEKAAPVTQTDSTATNAASKDDKAPPKLDERLCWRRTITNLDLFGLKIDELLEVQAEVSDIKVLHEIDFLKVNAQPVKQAISTWVTKWLYIHTQYLQNYVGDQLVGLFNFIRDVNRGLDRTIESGDREALMSVMTVIRDVRKRMPEIAGLIDPLRAIVGLLKIKAVPIELPPIGGQTAMDFLEQAKMLWENTVNKTFRIKESVQPLQNSMLDGVKKEIKVFEANMVKFAKEVRSSGPFSWLETKHKDAYVNLDRCQAQLSKLVERSKAINELEDLFELPLSKHVLVADLEDDLRLLKGVWDQVLLVESNFATWKNTLWAEIKTDDLMEEIKRIQNQLKKQPKKTREWGVFKTLEQNVKNLNTTLPLIHELHSPAMRERHWKSLVQLCGTSIDRGASFCLNDLLVLNLHRHVDAVSEIVEVATKELKIEARLSNIEEAWRKFTLKFDRHRDTEVFIVSPPDEILETLEEHSLHLQGMAGMGKFVDHFRDQVLGWQATLGEVESTLRMILIVERQWGSLESIFLGSADIRSQLPDDSKRFESIDMEFKEVMQGIQSKPGVIQCCTADGRETSLRNMNKELEKCEKALNEYLEIKKSVFPRFYFVSNAALLDILSNGNNLPKIMPHVGSVFDGIGDLDLCLSAQQAKSLKDDPELPTGPLEAAKAMVSKDRETVPFAYPFEMKGAVENWLNDLVRFQQQTLKDVLVTSMSDATGWDVDRPREDWVFTVCAQIALTTSQIIWTEEVEHALEEIEGGAEDAVKKYVDMCSLRLEGLIRLVQGELSKGDRIKIITVITIDVHNRDVVQALVTKKVESNVDFKWQSQLRYYWVPEERSANIRICDFATVYSFEYVGNCGRLVITPLTDRCYVTLTVALRLMLGGAPAGPAGTGKTETTKDLARGLGLPCYVFNCSDQMNYQTMGDIFKGLAQVGAWGCFDEFNRIEIEVLSVVATQVKTILDAITHFANPSNRSKEFQGLPSGTPPVKVGIVDFFGASIALIPTVGLFITMNPGYAGRTELPENLKALFRSCAMIQPDFLPISENMLMAEGFVRARPLSVKFVTLYKLSSELLSKQHHYDWGLRAIKSVLRVAGVLKRADPEFEEEAILMRALRDFNTPKIPANDIPIFLRLISDLFPGLDLPPKGNPALSKICTEVCKASGLQAEDLFISKVMQFEELLDVRHSVFLLGPTGCGKTAVWKTLAGCLNHGKSKVVCAYETVNPKSVNTDELYGYMTLSKDWRDGVLSIIMRNMSKNNSPFLASQTSKWVVLDGDIDAIWIESMNTVMDDNKVLTLVSNERIPLTEAMRMVFEISSLKNATPATVSRAGILFINDTDVGYQPYIDSWLSLRALETEKASLPDLFERYLGKIVEFFVSSKLETVVPLPMINLVQSMCFMLDGLLRSLRADDKNPASIERVFLYSAMWAFGGSLAGDKQIDYRRLFTVFFRGLSKTVKFPEGGLVHDYFIDFASGEVVAWQSKVAAFASSAPSDGGSTQVVPTADTVRLTFMMDVLVRSSRPVMFVGSAGTGKTILVGDYLSSLSVTDESFKSAAVNMNFYTDSYALQQQLEQNIDKRSGKSYGPPSGRLIFFVDDLNLPFVETYGTQTPIALMRQHIDHQSWFDRSDMGLKKTIIDCQYVACMNQKSGSFFVDPRLQRHFATFSCQMPGETDLSTIFGTILSSHMGSLDKKLHSMAKKLTDATIALHKEVLTKFLPSAVKFHYNFTMRDLAAVFRGLLNSRPKEFKLAPQLTRLWYHEVMRVFSDRLMTDAEVQRCREIVINVGKRFMEDDPEVAYVEPCTFTHFTANEEEVSVYVPCDDTAKLKRVLDKKLADYNETNAIMNLVLFEQAMRHISRITRILMFPGGNALLVGVGGSGKQSLSKLAAFICQYQTMQISVTSDYSINDLKEHLKDMYRKAAVKPGLPLTFILTDSQITDERFLVYINDLLSSGRIPDLFTKEEYDGVFASLRQVAKAEGIPDNRDSMMTFFINKVRANLHVILCFSPVGDLFRQRARKFPGIINCTAIDWFQEWPKDALVSVAQRFLEKIETGGRPEVRDNIAYHVAEVHSSVGLASLAYFKEEKRFNYTTPKSFLELIEFYKQLLAQRRADMFAGIERLDTGLNTLMRTNQDVEKLQEFLKEKKKEVEAKKAATDALLEEMGKQRSEAEAQQAIADVEKKKADAAAAEAKAIEEQCAGDLRVAKPALDAANDAVNCLDKASMTELKSFSKPPAGVDKVTTALLVMIKGEKKDFSWENAKKMMAKIDAFKEKLEQYKGEDIPDETITKVLPMLDDPDFNFDRMKTKSGAAANLCNWVVNIVQYNGIYKRVKPLMDSLEVASKAKRKAEDDLAVVKEKLDVIQGKLNKLQAEFMAATQEKAKVEAEAKECMDRLSLAERLTSGLASEKDRWGVTVDGLRNKESTMAGDVMLAAAFCSYTGAFGINFRSKLWREVWLPDLIARDVPLTPNIDPLWVLTSDSETAVWQNEGLPADRISIENGAIMTNCNRWPLLIDPQLQGIRWLKRHEEVRTQKNGRRMHLLKIGEKSWMLKIVAAIQAGDTVILEGVGESLDASLDPILSKSVYRKGRALYIKLGEEDVEYDDSFRLYLQTKLANPHYRPEISAQCTLINFIVTKKGLEDQLLATIVSVEEPALEETRNSLVQAFNTYKIQLKELEDQLLERLANAPADILSDIPLIEGLEATKETATEINEAVIKGRQTEIGINVAREVYRVVATEASLLYFVLLQLCAVDHMYQYSLDSFTLFFLKALTLAPNAAEKAERVKGLQSTLRWTIFKWVVRGLFEKHRIVFLTQLTLSLMQAGLVGDDTGFSAEGLRFMLLGTRGGDERSPVSWIPDATWVGIRNISMLEGFEKLPGDIEENPSRFLEWFQSFTPESEKLPGDWRELDKRPFEKLLVVRVLRPDRLTAALTGFIRETIPSGKDYVECDSELSSYQVVESSFEDSTPLIPLFFILSPGANPLADVDKLAHKVGKTMGLDYHNVSLGQGQDVVAAERLEIGNRQGHWVFLNNVHLMPRWLPFLEKKLDEYAVNGTHENFRIMLSSDPSTSIPVSILDRAIKITADPPSGMKANLKQAFAAFSKETYEELEPRTKGILFGLCQFHAVMIERKKFGSKGYNMMYPFSVGDLTCSAAVLRNYMDSAPARVPWADLRYLFGEIMYGGHIVNDFDRLLASTYLEFYMKEELLDEMVLYPFLETSKDDAFRAPGTNNGYESVVSHIDETLKTETPLAFGLHPNAEIGFRTQTSERLLQTILELSTSSGGGGGGGDGEAQSSQSVAEAVIQDVLETLRDTRFELEAVTNAVEEIGPFQNIVLQEAERMNALLQEIVRSLLELDSGFKGDLTISDTMEELANSLYLDRVPRRWELLAYPSLRGLATWLSDLQARIAQLNDWVASPAETPICTWISGLFNPQSFLTAVMQTTAQKENLELDKLTLLTDVTKKMLAEEMQAPAKEGTYIIGLSLEGGSWNNQNSLLEPSKPREMFCPLPVINVRPAVVDKFDPSSFQCPVYKTQQRGPTYVFSLQLRTKHEPGKWVLSGVVAVMDCL